MSAINSLNVQIILSMRTRAEHYVECLNECELTQAPKELSTLLDTIRAIERAARRDGNDVPRWPERSRIKALVKGFGTKHTVERKEFDQLITSNDSLHAHALGICLD
jgi:hypothetical protein